MLTRSLQTMLQRERENEPGVVFDAVGAATLGGRRRSNAASDKEKPPGQRPSEGQTVGLNVHWPGQEPITLSVPLRTNSRIQCAAGGQRTIPIMGKLGCC